ncbi:MAG: autotransporter-associated beta strand repeat-containing protein [Luteolibacter sp.]|uniref:beta strand repeat-containing protein n=1 Tax=Luteolibacter sp. TaxID=1962973 RepID=UPI003265777C
MKPNRSTLLGFRALGLSLLAFWMTSAARAANIWDGGGAPDGNWGTIANWDDNLLPVFPVALNFAGTAQLASVNNQTGIAVNGIAFDASAGAFTISGNSISLGGNVTNNSTSLQTLGLPLGLTAARTFDAASGNIAVVGAISGSFGFTKIGAGTMTVSGANSNTLATTITAGTLKLGASNALTSTAGITFGTNSTGTLDLAGFTQTTGNFTATTNTAANGGTVTSSAAGGNLTINTGATNGAPFSQTAFTNGTGTLALTLLGSNPTGNVQILNTTNSFSGGLTIKSSNVGSLTSANLATAGGLTAQTLQGVRSNATAAIGSGGISIDNGQLFIIASLNVSNSLNFTARGGVLHMEGTGAATGGFTGTITNPGGLVVANSNSGNNNIVKLGNVSGFTGTLAIDATNIGGLAFNETSVGNTAMNLLWYGNGTNGGTGRVQYRGTGDATLIFGDLNNLNSGAVGSAMSGIIENAIASTTATFAIGNSNATPATFQGLIRNGTGTVALTKNGSNTQTLTGVCSFTGATAVNGGILRANNSFASAVDVNTGGTFIANGSDSGSVNVHGGGSVGGTGFINGVVTLASGSSPANRATVNVVDGAVGILFATDSGGILLGGTAGNSVSLNMEVGPSTADLISLSGDLNVGAGGAVITMTSLGVAANQTYDLISFANGTGAGFTTGSGTTIGGLTLANPSLGFGVTGSLNVTANAVQLVTTGAASPAAAYWSGSKGTSWTSNSSGQGNFTTTAAGGTFLAALPGSTTDVFFSNNSPSNLTNTLGGNFAINGLTFRGTSAAASIGGANQLSLQSGGITLESGNGGATLGMTTLSLGDSQTWTNNSANPLVVTAAVSSGANGLTLSGNVIKLGGSSLATGTLTIDASLDVAGTAITTGDFSGSGSVNNTGAVAAINATVVNDSAFSGTISDAGAGSALSLVKNGSATLTLGGANGYNGSTLVGGGTLVLGNASALGVPGTVASGSGTTVANGASLDLNGLTISESLSVAGAGYGSSGALVNSNVGTPAVVNSEMLSNGNFAVDGAGDITLQRVQTTFATLTKNGANTLTLGTPAATAPNNLLVLVVNGGKVVLNMPGQLAVDRGLTINNGSNVQLSGTAAGGGQIQDDNAVALNSGTFDLNGRSEIIGALNGSVGTSVTNTAAATVSTFGVGGVPATTNTGSFAGVISDGAGKVALTKSGLGTQTIAGAQTYTGDTRVNGGILSLDTAFFANTADVYIATGAVLNLTHSGTDVVNALYFNGVAQANGIYDAGNSGGLITGTGKIQVGATPAGYASWAVAKGLTAGVNDGVNQDPDFDGIANLLEYVLGGLPIGAGSSNTSILPTSSLTTTDLVVSFKRSDLSESDTTLKVQWSTNLGTWGAPDEVTIGATSAGIATVTEDSPSVDLDTVSVAVPRTNAAGGKLFARVIATKP